MDPNKQTNIHGDIDVLKVFLEREINYKISAGFLKFATFKDL